MTLKNKGLCGILDMNRKKRICLVEGENEMCEKVDQLARQREQEAVLVTLFEGVQDGGLRVTYAAKKANLSLNDFKDQMRLRGFSVPQRKGRSSTVKKA